MGIFDFLKGRKLSTNGLSSSLDIIDFAPEVKLPRAFAEFWPAIETTKMLSVGMTIVPNANMTFSQSKFGHYPCMPVNFEYPKDSDGHYMFPLAQINWKKVPPLQGYPTSGLLQFYISAHSDVYGLNFDNGQSQIDFGDMMWGDGALRIFSFIRTILQRKIFQKSCITGIVPNSFGARHYANKHSESFSLISCHSNHRSEKTIGQCRWLRRFVFRIINKHLRYRAVKIKRILTMKDI